MTGLVNRSTVDLVKCAMLRYCKGGRVTVVSYRSATVPLSLSVHAMKAIDERECWPVGWSVRM